MSPSACVTAMILGFGTVMPHFGKAFVAPISGVAPLQGRESVTKTSVKPSKSVRTSCRMAAEDATEEATTDGSKKKATKPPAWMFNDDGVAYAPWMVDQFDPENLAKVQAAMEARKKKEAEMVPEAYGALARDPQQMELSGAGLKAKRIGDDMVELQWTTGDESGNIGFIVNRRKGKTDDWEELASYETFAPLNSRGDSGGTYTYVDEGVEEGTWVYRISDINKSGARSDLCQTLIEVQSSADALQHSTKRFTSQSLDVLKKTKIGVGFLAVALLAAIAAGTVIDPFAQ